MAIYFSLEQEVKEITKAEQVNGSLESSVDEKLMKSVLQNDKKTVDEGKLVEEALNMNITSFTPDLLYENIVQNFQLTQRMIGPSIIRLLSGYDESYVEKNLRIPEFKKEIKENIKKNIEELKDHKILNKQGGLTEKAIDLASLQLFIREIEHLSPRGFVGEKVSKETAHYGEPAGVDSFRKGDRYRDIAIKPSVRVAIRRGHTELALADLRKFNRVRKGNVYIVYGIDASASMKGKKIAVCKKAGVALAFRAWSQKDKVGLIVFGDEVRDAVRPTLDFSLLLNKITRVTASKQTNFVEMIRKAIDLFPDEKVTKHLLILTDAMPTHGDSPESKTFKAVSMAKDHGITVSLVGIGLDKAGIEFARKCTELGEGRLYIVRDLETLDRIVLEDYATFS